jgi:hypothetical protein
LKQVVIGSIDEDDVDSGLSQHFGGIEAAEAATDDDNSGLRCFSHSSKGPGFFALILP